MRIFSFFRITIDMKIAPILDEHAPWKQRYRLHQHEGHLARCNNQRGLVISNRSGIYQLYAWDVADGKLRQLTQCPFGKERGQISSNGRYVYYLDDHQGDETGHFVRIDVDTGEQIDLTPDVERYSQLGFQTDCIDRMIAYITADSENGYRLYAQSVMQSTIGKPSLIYQSSDYMVNSIPSYDGGFIVVEITDIKIGSGSKLVVFDSTNGSQPINTLDDGPEANMMAKQFATLSDDSRLLGSSNRSGTNRPFIWDVRTGIRTDLELPQLGNEGDIYPQDWSPDGELILLLHIHNAIFQLYCYRMSDRSSKKLTEQPSGTIYNAQFGPSGMIFVHWEGANAPQQVIALNSESGALERMLLGPSENEVLPKYLWRSITFPSFDGQIIQGWIALPNNSSHRPFPTIIHMHGGPRDVASDQFNLEAGAWLDHGFTYLTINYRGSITFGREFQNKIYGNIGHYEIEDIVAARAWLIEEDIALPKAIFLTGWSYGGYLTLLALGKRPDLWAGGIARGGIADFAAVYEDSAESLKGYATTLFAGTPKEKSHLYEAASPISYVEKIIAPVLVIQANDDTRCPARQMRNFESRMRELNKDFDIEWHTGGHQLNNTEQSISHMERMLRWAYRVLNK